MTTKLYLAYGSNLNKEQMKFRCPAAIPVGKYMLRSWKLVFRGVADIVPAGEHDFVLGGVWKITPECEAALDRYEGFNPDDPAHGMYSKRTVAVSGIEGGSEMMFYTMNSEGIFPPSRLYLASIEQGYRDFGLSRGPLTKAVEASHDDRAPSHIERKRHRRAGLPILAARPSKKTATKVRHQKQRKPVPPVIYAPAPKQEAATQLDLDLFRRAMTVYGD